jgi:hypothetical protein
VDYRIVGASYAGGADIALHVADRWEPAPDLPVSSHSMVNGAYMQGNV